VAAAATYVVNGTSVTTTAAIYTVPTASTVPYGTYARDLIITNGGPSSCFYSLGTGSTVATTAGSFNVPSGGSLVLTQCQVPAGGIIFGVSAGTSSTYVGYGSVVSVI
jgi:hypothetical protein